MDAGAGRVARVKDVVAELSDQEVMGNLGEFSRVDSLRSEDWLA
jgi:hypothetical protein